MGLFVTKKIDQIVKMTELFMAASMSQIDNELNEKEMSIAMGFELGALDALAKGCDFNEKEKAKAIRNYFNKARGLGVNEKTALLLFSEIKEGDGGVKNMEAGGSAIMKYHSDDTIGKFGLMALLGEKSPDSTTSAGNESDFGASMLGLEKIEDAKDLAHKIGKIFHGQLIKAMTSQQRIFSNLDEIAYTSGYLKEYFHHMFVRYTVAHPNLDDSLERKLLKMACDGAIRKKLWDVYLKGESLGQPGEASNQEQRKQLSRAYMQGVQAGTDDSNETYFEGTLPSQLTKYLTATR